MSLGAVSQATDDGVNHLLADPRFELMPFDSFESEIEALPTGSAIAITTSPQLGIESTVDRAELAASMGYEVVPHIAARYVNGDDQLRDIARRLTGVGITDMFVPGGDREEPAGSYESALDLLEALDDMPYSFDEIGITGYPEGHDFISDKELTRIMNRKAPYATYIVTQLCYDHEAILEWISDIRDQGIELPVEIGIPGVMNYAKLLKISHKVGVGDSIKFLRKTSGIVDTVKRFVGSRGVYKPDDLIDGLAPYYDDDKYNIDGVHIYTFNQTPDVESWRQNRVTQR
jgi:methylenetetrahydrofolate reductase (NADPH)